MIGKPSPPEAENLPGGGGAPGKAEGGKILQFLAVEGWQFFLALLPLPPLHYVLPEKLTLPTGRKTRQKKFRNLPPDLSIRTLEQVCCKCLLPTDLRAQPALPDPGQVGV